MPSTEFKFWSWDLLQIFAYSMPLEMSSLAISSWTYLPNPIQSLDTTRWVPYSLTIYQWLSSWVVFSPKAIRVLFVVCIQKGTFQFILDWPHSILDTHFDWLKTPYKPASSAAGSTGELENTPSSCLSACILCKSSDDLSPLSDCVMWCSPLVPSMSVSLNSILSPAPIWSIYS